MPEVMLESGDKLPIKWVNNKGELIGETIIVVGDEPSYSELVIDMRKLKG
jgi:hypothetical protein